MIRAAGCILVAGAISVASDPTHAFTPAEALAPMTVTLVRSDAPDCGSACGEWLALTGQIFPGSVGLLRAALNRLGHRSVPVLVDSPGGNVDAALLMGRMIRDHGLDVVVSGSVVTDCSRGDQACQTRLRAGEHPGYLAAGIAACASACVLLLAAGTERSVPADSYVGVHQIVTHLTLRRVINTFRVTRRLIRGRVVEVSRRLIATRPVSTRTVQKPAPEALYSEVDRYLLGMGIGEAIMPLMRSAAPSSVHWMSRWELAQTGISTDVMDAATLVARAVAPKPVVLEAALAKNTAPGDVEGRFVAWRVTQETARGKGPECPVIEARADLPEERLQAAIRFGPAADQPGDQSSIRIDLSPLGAPTTEPEIANASLEFRRYAHWNGLPIGSSAVRRDGHDFEIRVDAMQKADAVWTAFVSRWLALVLTRADGKKLVTRFPMADLRDAMQQWLRPCGQPETPAITVAAAETRDTSDVLGPAMAIRSDRSIEHGSVRWHLDLSDTTPPKLVAHIDLPSDHLHVQVSLDRSRDIAIDTDFFIRERFSRDADTMSPPILSVALPQLRDAAAEDERPIAGVVVPLEADSFSIALGREKGDGFVSGLQDRDWLALPVVFGDGRTVNVVVSLGGDVRRSVDAWLYGCCRAAGPTEARPAAAPVPERASAAPATP